jgi:hypothetical protein
VYVPADAIELELIVTVQVAPAASVEAQVVVLV